MAKQLSKEREVIINSLRDTFNEWVLEDSSSVKVEDMKSIISPVKIEDMKSIISSIESGCHAHTIDICDENGYDKRFDSTMFLITYSSITSKILYNLQKNDINRPLVNKIINGELDLYYLATLSSEELCPEANAKIRENLELRKQQKIKKNICDLYTCSKCKHNKTTTYTKQTRALDEGMTTFVQCENCHYKWTL